MQEVWSLLFSQPKFKENLEKDHLLRYKKANSYASQYCLKLMGMQHIRLKNACIMN